MKYVLTPTDDDILHYKKGSESKKHNYISRVFQKGRWVYTYAKNRARGNKVTNKTKGTTPYSPNEKRTVTNNTKGTTPYNPNVKTVENEVTKYLVPKGNTVASTADTHIIKTMTQVMDPTTKQSGLEAFDNIIQSQQKESVTNRSYAPGNDKPIDYQYTPSYNRNSSSTYSPTMKTLKYTDGKYRPTEPLDWRKKASTKTNKGHAINATKGGFPVKK